MIEIQNFNKIYPNGIQAVFDLNLKINDKEFVVFVGPSGCGKSSTLRSIAGLESISSGNLFINGVLSNNASPKDRKVSMVFQNYALYPNLSVFKNIRFPLENDKKRLYLFFKNNFLIRNEIKKLFWKLNQADNKKIDKLDLLKSQLLELKNSKKRFETNCVSNILRLKSKIKFEKTKTKAKLTILNKNKIDFIKRKNLDEIQKIKEQNLKIVEIDKKEIAKIKKNKQIEIAIINNKLNKLKKEIYLIKKELNKVSSSSFNKKDFIQKRNEIIKKHKIYNPYFAWLKENNEKVLKTAQILGLSDYIYRKPRDLSGGQRQRVALGRAIVRNPQIFLLDEPLSNLDAKLRTEMRETILSIHKKIGASTIYVTHDQVEAMTMASKIVVLKDGFVQQIGSPENVYSKPSNMFVGGFIGNPEMNFIKGKIVKQKFISNEFNLEIPNYIYSKIKTYENKEIIFGIRPEHFSTSLHVQDTYKDTIIKFKIHQKELLGKEVILYGSAPNSKNNLRILLPPSSIFIDKDNFIKVAFDKNKMHFFDPKTTISINHKKNNETNLALEIYEKGKNKRELNKELLRKERNKQKNKGIIKKIIKYIVFPLYKKFKDKKILFVRNKNEK